MFNMQTSTFDRQCATQPCCLSVCINAHCLLLTRFCDLQCITIVLFEFYYKGCHSLNTTVNVLIFLVKFVDSLLLTDFDRI